ncbi:ATP-binding protein [Streptomyces sp. NPDC014779]|uniref:ATP-binding protein n=1 Tax=unclassified Streptomyces TaxID=2593676 RepID=UPI003701B8D5
MRPGTPGSDGPGDEDDRPPDAAAAPEPGPFPGAQVRRLLLDGSAGAVTRCREFTAVALRDWGWLPADTPEGRERAEDVLLMVSEVVTNACLHTAGPEELVLRHAGGLLRLEVADGSPEPPRPNAPRSPALPGGHGLMVLNRLAGAWGAEPKPDGAPGKVVWAEIARPSQPPWWRTRGRD